MPTYDYECEACGYEFEAFQSMSAKLLKKCPECGEPTLKRLIGIGAGVIFKGSGFYETDYRSAGYKKSADAEKKGSEKPKVENESKGENKNESKVESKSSESSEKTTVNKKKEKSSEGKKKEAEV